MKIKFRLYGVMKITVGSRELNRMLPKKSCLGDALRQLEDEFKDQFIAYQVTSETMQQIRVLLNGQDHMSLEGMDTLLTDGDTITLLPQITGGAGNHSIIHPYKEPK